MAECFGSGGGGLGSKGDGKGGTGAGEIPIREKRVSKIPANKKPMLQMENKQGGEEEGAVN